MAKNDKVLEIIKEKMIEKIERAIETNDIAPWRKPWLGSKCNYISSRNYRGINTLLLPDDETHFLTYNQIKKLQEMKKYADIKLKDNTESFIVVLWKWYKQKFEEENPETGETEEVYKQVPSIRYYKVYRASDVINLPKKELTPEEVRTVEDADSFIEALDIDLRIMKGSDRAYCSPNFDFVSVPAREQFPNSYEWYSTTFHEIGHWTGHESRLKRNIKNSFGDQAYSREELCAECISGILTSYFNIIDENMEKNNIAYLTGWLDNIRKGELNYIVWASQKAHEAAEYLLSQTGLLDVSEETQRAS